MTIDCTGIAGLITEIQHAYFEDGELTLTPSDIEQRFGADRLLAAAVLDLLASASVLRQRDDGTYVRCLPASVAA
jgi:hypothetical protein